MHNELIKSTSRKHPSPKRQAGDRKPRTRKQLSDKEEVLSCRPASSRSAKRNTYQPRCSNEIHQTRPTSWLASPPGPHRPPVFQLLSDLNVSLSVHPVDIVVSPSAPPRDAPGVVLLLRHVEYRTDVVNLTISPVSIERYSFSAKQPTLRSVSRAFTGTKGFNETTTAPSFKSRNLGRIDSFTADRVSR